MTKLTGPKLKKLSALRRKEAAALLRQGHHAAAYYLMGYSVECALKACIAKQTNKLDFPDKVLAQKAYTHDLEVLMGLSGLKPAFEADRAGLGPLALNWTIVKDWSEEARYDLSVTKTQARDLYTACTSRKFGVLTWIRKKW